MLRIILQVMLLTSGIFSFAQGGKAYKYREQAESMYQQYNWAAAVQAYQQYIKDTSASLMDYNRLGYSYHNLKKYEEARMYLLKSHAMRPASPISKFTIEMRTARASARLNDTLSTIQWIDSAIHTGYQHINEFDTLSDFNHIRHLASFKQIRQKVYAAAYPCTLESRNADFDFWIGDWDVFLTGSQTLVGHNVIERIAGGCALLENWESVTGTQSGKSVNYYNPAAKKWEQDWISSSGSPQRFSEGEYKNGVMQFSFTTIVNGKNATGRFFFYKLGNGDVRQYQETSVDAGKTYQAVYDFTYTRRK